MGDYEYTIGKVLDLKAEQEKTLATPVLPANLVLHLMYVTFDVLYGFKRTLPKLKVLEILARYPYWAWENGSYLRLSRGYARAQYTDRGLSETALRHIDMGRRAQDNEQEHMMLIEDIMRQKGIKQGWIRFYLMPRLLAFGYYFFTRALYRVLPKWSFAMNAAFESHAEHEYMKMADENPAWEDEPVDSAYFDHYPRQKSMADLIRRIALDERDHMNASLEELDRLGSKGG